MTVAKTHDTVAAARLEAHPLLVRLTPVDRLLPINAPTAAQKSTITARVSSPRAPSGHPGIASNQPRIATTALHASGNARMSASSRSSGQHKPTPAPTSAPPIKRELDRALHNSLRFKKTARTTSAPHTANNPIESCAHLTAPPFRRDESRSLARRALRGYPVRSPSPRTVLRPRFALVPHRTTKQTPG